MANFQFSVRLKSRPQRTLTARDGEGWSLFSAIVNWRESFHGMLKSGSSSRNNPEYPLTGWRCVVSVCVECVLFLSPESEVDRLMLKSVSRASLPSSFRRNLFTL